jgi:glycosyltransferase involved in cell wall biosynthesis
MAAQRILFVITFNDRRNGIMDSESVRTGGVGVSGTDQSIIIAAEQLALHGHTCCIAGNFTKPGTVTRGVIFTDLSLTGAPRAYDILCVCSWYRDFESLPIDRTSVKAIWLLCQHWAVDAPAAVAKFANACCIRKVVIIALSEWSRGEIRRLETGTAIKTNKEAGRHRYDVVDVVIPNGLMLDVAESIDMSTKARLPKTMVFHAVWERGGHLAAAAFEALGWQTGGAFHMYDYWGNLPNSSAVCCHGSTDKRTLLTKLAETEYFVYPSVLPNGGVHKDTFACVVAEACAMGVIVLAFPLGALKDLYGDAVVWLDWPPGFVVPGNLAQACFQACPELTSPAVVEGIVAKIRWLEERPDVKAAQRQRAMEHARRAFDPAALGELWNNLTAI